MAKVLCSANGWAEGELLLLLCKLWWWWDGDDEEGEPAEQPEAEGHGAEVQEV